MIEVEALIEILDREPPELDVADVEEIADWLEHRQRVVEQLSEIAPAMLTERERRKLTETLQKMLREDERRLSELGARRRDIEDALVRAGRARAAVHAYGGQSPLQSGVVRRG